MRYKFPQRFPPLFTLLCVCGTLNRISFPCSHSSRPIFNFHLHLFLISYHSWLLFRTYFDMISFWYNKKSKYVVKDIISFLLHFHRMFMYIKKTTKIPLCGHKFTKSVLVSGLVDKLPNQNFLSNAGYKGKFTIIFIEQCQFFCCDFFEAWINFPCVLCLIWIYRLDWTIWSCCLRRILW